jgi:2-amino-4-hydroxy-6-hydroxymethyldihydropteridine diphosphokinase
VATVYLSLGSNLGDREANLRAALHELRPNRVSAIYETEPVGLAEQPWFLNLVAELETALYPEQLLAEAQRIEHDLGRVRTIPNGPRTVDIDVLLYDDAVLHTPQLEIPHPRLHERRFVLAPLAELTPDLRHPVIGQTVIDMLKSLPTQPICRLWTPQIR